MDVDLTGIRVNIIQESVLKIINSQSFIDNLRPYGIQRIDYQDLEKAKRIETTQRFKVHLVTFSGEDLFTKIEFSR